MDSADHPPEPPKANPLAAKRSEFIDPRTGGLDYQRVVGEIVGAIKSFDPTLDLSTVKSVRASSDYRGLLAQISTEMGRTITATERSDGVGMAMLVHGTDGDVLALDVAILDGMFHADEDMMRLTVNLLHHELSHAHDSAAKRRSFADVWLKQPVTGVSCQLFPLADAVWCEYFANRRSYPTWPSGKHMHASMFAQQIPAVSAAVKRAIKAYRLHRSIPRLLDAAIPHINFLFMLTGYVMGTVHGAGGTLQDLDTEAAGAVNGSYFEPAWAALSMELDRMYETHGQWPGLTVYAPLEAIASSVMRSLGLDLGLRDGQPYLNVPFTLDTLPG